MTVIIGQTRLQIRSEHGFFLFDIVLRERVPSESS